MEGDVRARGLEQVVSGARITEVCRDPFDFCDLLGGNRPGGRIEVAFLMQQPFSQAAADEPRGTGHEHAQAREGAAFMHGATVASAPTGWLDGDGVPRR